MPWIEFTTFEDDVLARIKFVLTDNIEIEQELMSIPSTSIKLPMEYYDMLSQGLKKAKIHFNGNIFDAMVEGITTDPETQTIDVNLSHLIKTWDFRQIPTNKAVKAKKLQDVLKDKDFIYDDSWTLSVDDDAKEEEIDYVYSRQGKLEALTQTMELTQDLWWRVRLD